MTELQSVSKHLLSLFIYRYIIGKQVKTTFSHDYLFLLIDCRRYIIIVDYLEDYSDKMHMIHLIIWKSTMIQNCLSLIRFYIKSISFTSWCGEIWMTVQSNYGCWCQQITVMRKLILKSITLTKYLKSESFPMWNCLFVWKGIFWKGMGKWDGPVFTHSCQPA